MKSLTRIAIVAVVVVASLSVAQAGHAAPPSNTTQAQLTDQSRLVSVKSSALPVQTITGAQYIAERAAAGQPLSEAEAKMIPNSCASGGASSWGSNIYGGTLFKLTLNISWCYDGSSVWSGSFTWSWSTGYGWSFNKWTNSPNGWYVPGSTEYHAVAQARFCVAWCAQDGYAGIEDIGNRSGAFNWHTV